MDIKVILAELYAERKRIDQAIAAVEELNGATPGVSEAIPVITAPTPAKEGKRRISAAGRRRIAEAAKKRWAERRKSLGLVEKVAEKASPKRKMSAAARQRIAEGAKKRWAERKKAEKKA